MTSASSPRGPQPGERCEDYETYLLQPERYSELTDRELIALHDSFVEKAQQTTLALAMLEPHEHKAFLAESSELTDRELIALHDSFVEKAQQTTLALAMLEPHEHKAFLAESFRASAAFVLVYQIREGVDACVLTRKRSRGRVRCEAGEVTGWAQFFGRLC